MNFIIKNEPFISICNNRSVPKRKPIIIKTLPRREREKLRKRKEILAAALDLFSEKGYHNVSMNEISRKSEFAIGTLYNFFNNKEELYKSLISEQADIFHETLKTAMEKDTDEIVKLRNYIRIKGEVFRANIAVVRLYFAETRGLGFNIMTGLDSDIRRQYRDSIQRLAVIFETGIKSKKFKAIADPYHLAAALDSVTHSFLSLWLEDPERHPYPEDPDYILNIILREIINPESCNPIPLSERN